MRVFYVGFSYRCIRYIILVAIPVDATIGIRSQAAIQPLLCNLYLFIVTQSSSYAEASRLIERRSDCLD